MMKQDISFSVDDITLRGQYFAPDSGYKSQAAMFIHGWTGNPNNHAAEALAEAGYFSMVFSMPGHNDSDGDINLLTRKDSLKVAKAAYDLFVSLMPDNTPIAIVGNSYGGYIGPLLAGEREVNGLSLRVPANYSDEGFDQPQMGQGHEDPEVMKWRRQIQPASETRALRIIREFKGPLQIIEAGQDDVIPHETIQSYIEAYGFPEKLEYIVMKDWPHSLSDDKVRNKQFKELLINWLGKL